MPRQPRVLQVIALVVALEAAVFRPPCKCEDASPPPEAHGDRSCCGGHAAQPAPVPDSDCNHRDGSRCCLAPDLAITSEDRSCLVHESAGTVFAGLANQELRWESPLEPAGDPRGNIFGASRPLFLRLRVLRI